MSIAGRRAKQSYTFYAGTDDLDAATLLAGQTGFDRGERLAGTVAAVRRGAGTHGPLVYRYTGMRRRRAPSWPAPSGWSTRWPHLGRLDEAASLMDDAIGLANDVGLLSEQMDPAPAPCSATSRRG